MQSSTIPYLNFSGNCREALTFYQACFGGELHLQTIQDGSAVKFPESMADLILQGKLVSGKIAIMGTDLVNQKRSNRHNASIWLECHAPSDIVSYYDFLQKGGNIVFSLREMISENRMFACVIDMFHTEWMLNCNLS
jgi:PhnB protein